MQKPSFHTSFGTFAIYFRHVENVVEGRKVVLADNLVLRTRKKILDKDPTNSLEDTDTEFCFILARVSYACSAKLSEGTWLRCAIAHLDDILKITNNNFHNTSSEPVMISEFGTKFQRNSMKYSFSRP